MAGTVFFALIPLYLTAWQDAIHDGALLILAVAFLADAAFRCFNPSNHKGSRNVIFGVGSMALMALALLQYGPIANDLRKEKNAMNASLQTRNIVPLANFEVEREEDESTLPNSSVALLLCSIVAEFSVIIEVES